MLRYARNVLGYPHGPNSGAFTRKGMTMAQQIYRRPTSGEWEGGRFYSFIPRTNGMASGVVIRRDVGGHELMAQNIAIEAAQTVDDLLAIPGAMASAVYFARVAA